MRVLKVLLVIGFFLSVREDSFSQSPAHYIQGYLYEKEQPIEFGYVIVRDVLDTPAIVGTAITDSTGFFKVKITGDFNYPLKLNITFQHLSFEEKQMQVFIKEVLEKETKLGKVNLLLKLSDLDEITVTGQRQLIKKEGSKLIYSISNDRNNKGKSLENILDGLPGVSVAPNGSLTLLGSSNIKTLINGKDIQINKDELKNMLKSYSSDIIESIEVMTSPSAEYDAAFSKVININLKQNHVGLASVMNLNYEQTIEPTIYFSNYTVYNSEKLNFSANINYGNSRNYEYSDFNRKILNNEFTTNVLQSNEIKIINKNYSVGGALTYKFNDRSNIVGAIKYNRLIENIPSKGMTDFKTNLSKSDSLIDSHNNSDNKLNSLFYKLGFETNFGKDSALNKLSFEYNRADYAFSSLIDNVSTFRYANAQETKEFHLGTDIGSKLQFDILKIDITPDFGKVIGLTIGSKMSKVGYKNDFDLYVNEMSAWVLDSVSFNHYKYAENNIAGYFKFKYSFKDWTVDGGLRVEKTYLSNKINTDEDNLVDSTYTNWFPSLSLMNKINDDHEVGFNYTRRITRPNYQDLDPTFFVLDPYSYLQGNILLKPQLSNNYEIIYTLKNRHLVALSLSKNANVIVQTPTQFANVLRLQPNNYDDAIFIDLFLSTPINISKWWKISPEYSFYKRSYVNSFSQGKVKNSNYSYYISLNNDFTLPKDFLVNFNFFYQGPDIAGIYQTEKFYTFSLNVRKAFFENKLNLSLSVRDILNSYKIYNRVNDLNQDLLIKQAFDSRVLSFSVSYRINKGKKVSGNIQKYNEEEFQRVK